MVTFKLIEIVDGFYRYEVYPEGNLHKKEVFEINPVTHELRRNLPASIDVDYVSKCIMHLTDQKGHLKSESMVVWG